MSSDAQELLRAEREALRPSPAGKAKILRAVQARVQSAEALSAPSPTTVAGHTVAKLVVITTGLLSLWAGLSRSPTPSSIPQASSGNSTAEMVVPSDATSRGGDQATAPRDFREVPAPQSPAPIATQATSSSVFRTKTISKINDRLGEEAVLLMRAEKQFHAGTLSESLAAIEEHRRRFPDGILAPERASLRALVLAQLNEQPAQDTKGATR